MPGLVIDFIRPLLCKIEKRTLVVMLTDIRSAKDYGYDFDEQLWKGFAEDIESEIDRRGGGCFPNEENWRKV